MGLCELGLRDFGAVQAENTDLASWERLSRVLDNFSVATSRRLEILGGILKPEEYSHSTSHLSYAVSILYWLMHAREGAAALISHIHSRDQRSCRRAAVTPLIADLLAACFVVPNSGHANASAVLNTLCSSIPLNPRLGPYFIHQFGKRFTPLLLDYAPKAKNGEVVWDTIRLFLTDAETARQFRDQVADRIFEIVPMKVEDRTLHSAVSLLAALCSRRENVGLTRRIMAENRIRTLIPTLQRGSAVLVAAVAKLLCVTGDMCNLASDRQMLMDASRECVKLLESEDVAVVQNAAGFLCNAIRIIKREFILNSANMSSLLQALHHCWFVTRLRQPEHLTALEGVVSSIFFVLRKLLTMNNEQQIFLAQTAAEQIAWSSNFLEVAFDVLARRRMSGDMADILFVISQYLILSGNKWRQTDCFDRLSTKYWVPEIEIAFFERQL